MMTTLSEAAGAAALESALRACQQANERLAAILANTMSQTDPAVSKGGVQTQFNWPKKIDTTGFDHSLSIARNLVVRHDTTRVYVAGCEGLRCLSKELGVPLFKIGTTSADLLQRLAEISADRYAAAYSLNDETIVDQEFDHWKLMSMDFSLPRAVESPVWIEPRALRITLPKMLSGKQFEARLREALAPLSLANWLRTEEAQRHLLTRGFSKARGERFTPYGYGDTTRLSRADELYIFRHRIDMPRLCRLSELIVQEAVPG